VSEHRVELLLSDEVVDQIADRAAALVLERLDAVIASRWMSVTEAAAYARCSVQHIYDMRSDGRLQRHGDPGHALVDRRELDAYLEGGRRER
jgi:excisionase family DNA binding protein